GRAARLDAGQRGQVDREPRSHEARRPHAEPGDDQRAIEGARRVPPHSQIGEALMATHAAFMPGAKTEPLTFWGTIASWLTTVDHKRIGILYGSSAFIFFLIGGTEALIMRLQLARPHTAVVGARPFNVLFRIHAPTMISLAIMPMSAAFFNFMIPLLIGARDVAFPRLTALSYWFFPPGGLFLHSSFLFGAV